MTASPALPRLKIAAHVRACRVDGQVFLLDLKANRYLGIGSAASEQIAPWIAGWPTESSDALPATRSRPPGGLDDAQADKGFTAMPRTPPPDSPAATTLERLLEQGLLSADGFALPGLDEGLRDLRAACLDEATASLDLGNLLNSPRVGARRFARFLSSAARAAWWLRTRSLYAIAAQVAELRERRRPHEGESLGSMVQAAVAYEQLRPLLLTAQEKCLFDSLALIGFMASEGLFPRWIIGVTSAPFGAHSWVQYGGTVLNDQHEYVRGFRPILIV